MRKGVKLVKDFIFQHDANLGGHCLRYAVLQFTYKDIDRIDYAAIIAEVDQDDYFELVEVKITPTLENAISYLREVALIQFGNEDLLLLLHELEKLN